MPDFRPADLKSWRKRFNLSQGKFVELSGLSTVTSIEAGSHKLRGQTLAKLIQAMKEVETSNKPGIEVAGNQPPIPAEVSPLAMTDTPKVEKPFVATPVGITNLDLELIRRILPMTLKEKFRLLESVMEE